MQVTVHHRDPVLLVASWHNVFFGYWCGGATVQALRILEGHERALHARLGERLAVYTIVEPSAMRFDEAARVEATRVAREMGPKVAGHAQVIDGTGLIAAAARAIVTGVNLLARQPHPARVFSKDGDAARWLVQFVQSAQPAATAALLAAVSDVRSRFAAGAAPPK
ncbi:MAG TPA: hypothetical protein VG389_17285 [Myxococcota bacterium]|nr:hypothetical protein [Myxococcota bacterium]